MFISSDAYSQSSESEKKVVLVSIPRVAWKDIQNVETPNIDRLVKDGSVANLSVRVPSPGRSIEKGYATISAGNRASAQHAIQSTFYGPEEKTTFGTALEIFIKEQGVSPKNAGALLLAAEPTFEMNSGLQAPARVGSFATVMQENSNSVFVLGNADFCLPQSPECSQRSIGFIGSNENGIVENGVVSRDLLKEDLTLDMELTYKLASDAIKENEVVAVECSNLEKLERWKRTTNKSIIDERFVEYLKQCDQLIGNLLQDMDLRKDQIFIFSPMSSIETEQHTVFISAGAEIEKGYATSGITRAEAIVALSDIAPSILRFYAIDPPSSMVDTSLSYRSSDDSVSDKIQRLIDMDDKAQIRDDSFNFVAGSFILITFLTTAIGLLSIGKYKSLREIAIALGYITLASTITPFLMNPFMLGLANPIGVVITYISLSMLIGLLVFGLGKKYSYLYSLFGFALFNVFILVADILSGGNLQFNSLFGNASIVSGRFAGFGNMAYSILAMSSVVAVACVKLINAEKTNANKNKERLLLIFFLIFVLVIIGLPIFGSDVGGVLAFTPTVFIISMMLFEKKINLKTSFIAFAITMLAIAIFSVFDLNRPESERTHLGRFVQVVADGEAMVVIERKIASNLDTFTNSIFLTVAILGAIYLLFLFAKPEEFVKKAAKNSVGIRYLVYPGALLAILSMLLNDSGVAIGGMMSAIAVPAFLVFSFYEDHQKSPQRDLADKNV